MTIRTFSRTARPLGLALVMAVGTAAAASAQGTPPSPGMMQQHHRMADTGMMTGSHHLLAMAYRDNLMTFARALQDDVKRTGAVNLDLARPAVAEMRRLVTKIGDHHKAQGSMSGENLKAPVPMPMTKDEMKAHLKTLGDLVSALELEIRAKPLNPAQVLEHTAAILKHCEGMMM